MGWLLLISSSSSASAREECRSALLSCIASCCLAPCLATRHALLRPKEVEVAGGEEGELERGTFAVGTPGATPHVFNKDAICQWTAIGRGLAQHRGSGLVCHGNVSSSDLQGDQNHGLASDRSRSRRVQPSSAVRHGAGSSRAASLASW